MSGTGKSHQAKRLISSAVEQGIQVDIIDVHNELHQAGTSSAIYSEATRLLQHRVGQMNRKIKL